MKLKLPNFSIFLMGRSIGHKPGKPYYGFNYDIVQEELSLLLYQTVLAGHLDTAIILVEQGAHANRRIPWTANGNISTEKGCILYASVRSKNLELVKYLESLELNYMNQPIFKLEQIKKALKIARKLKKRK